MKCLALKRVNIVGIDHSSNNYYYESYKFEAFMRLDSRIQSAARPIWKSGDHKSLENHPRTKEQFTVFYSETTCAWDVLLKVKLLSV